MSSRLQPNCHPLLIGSLPLNDHQSASRLIMDYSPAMPLWVQLPVFAQEKMVPQFLPGLPGVAGTAICSSIPPPKPLTLNCFRFTRITWPSSKRRTGWTIPGLP